MFSKKSENNIDIPDESNTYTKDAVVSPVEGKLKRGEKGTKLPEFKTFEELVEYLNKTGRGSDKNYDLKAAYNDPEVYQIWREEEEKNPGKGHWLDKYKKDSHPTYSSESILGEDPVNNGGIWINVGDKDLFIVSDYLANKYSLSDYSKYFAKEEPDAYF